MNVRAIHYQIAMPAVNPVHIAIIGNHIPTPIAVALHEQYTVTVIEDVTMVAEQPPAPFDLIFLVLAHNLTPLQYLRQQPHTATLPVMVLLESSDGDIIQHLAQFDRVDFVTRFVVHEMLLARIQLLLAQSARVSPVVADHETMRSELLRVAAHNLKSPLNTLKLVEDTLRNQHKDDQTHKTLDTLRATVKNMQGIIDDFMDMMMIQTGNLRLNYQPVDLFEVIMNVGAQYQLVAENKGIRLSYGKIGGQVIGDYRRLMQIVSNLVSNALKFSPRGTQVRLWTQQNNDMLRLCVADEGPGVRPEERHLLFQEFSRISTRPTGNESSTGLGLWIVKQLTNQMGGRVSAGFPPGGGAIFYVDLPLSPSA